VPVQAQGAEKQALRCSGWEKQKPVLTMNPASVAQRTGSTDKRRDGSSAEFSAQTQCERIICPVGLATNNLQD
jgi:hypothetical protein